MWLMSQEQRLWPERSPEIREGIGKRVPTRDAERKPRAQAARDFAASGILALPVAKEVRPEPTAQEETAIIEQREPGKAAAENRWITEATDFFPREGLTRENLTQEELRSEGSALAVQPFQLSAFEDSYATDATTDASISLDGTAPSSVLQRFTDWHVKLRLHPADLYLGVAVFVAALALLWPAAGGARPAAPGPWGRAPLAPGISARPLPVA